MLGTGKSFFRYTWMRGCFRLIKPNGALILRLYSTNILKLFFLWSYIKEREDGIQVFDNSSQFTELLELFKLKFKLLFP